MSNLSSLSAAAIKAMYSSETDEALIMLLTIYDPEVTNTDTPILRLADNFTKRISETDDEVVYGVTSRGHDFLFLPLQITLPSEQEGTAPSCSLVLNYVIPEAVELIRTQLTKSTKILLELVLSGNPDYVEASFPGFYITSATYNAQSITLSLNMISYVTEPFPCYNFTPNYFPGLF